MKVYKAINAVQGELAKTGISKDSKNASQGYMFRGIDDVYKAMAPLLAKHGLVIIPKVLNRELVERTTKSGGYLASVTVMVEYHLTYAPDGSSVVATIYGEAMDSADKATNKAMSAAYKYLCIQTFCIPTEGDNDADMTTHDVVVARVSDREIELLRNAQSMANLKIQFGEMWNRYNGPNDRKRIKEAYELVKQAMENGE